MCLRTCMYVCTLLYHNSEQGRPKNKTSNNNFPDVEIDAWINDMAHISSYINISSNS